QGEGLTNGQQARNLKKMKTKKVKAKASTDHEYLGCYRYNKDIGGLLKHGKSFFDMTDQALCRAHCEEYDTAFYAMEYGDTCWCPTSPDINDYIIDEDGDCDKPCTGDPSIFCGGTYSISMFEYQEVESSSTTTGMYEQYESPGSTTVIYEEYKSSSSKTVIYEEYEGSSGTAEYDDDEGYGSSIESVCSNGVPGIESNGVCCETSCGQCGGAGCSSVGNGAESCCTSTILEFGEVCGSAPCVI
ncbi:unnamed protein product, partial [Ectocarpus fasciculatus]